MTDRELLELAAKAHGFIDDQTTDDDGDQVGLHRNGQGIYYVVHKFGWHNWTPLIDDGDALRLVVALEIDLSFINGDTHADGQSEGGPDKGANTRRAIVRSAAEIGKAKP